MQIPSSRYTHRIMNKHNMFYSIVVANEKSLEQFIDYTHVVLLQKETAYCW